MKSGMVIVFKICTHFVQYTCMSCRLQMQWW